MLNLKHLWVGLSLVGSLGTAAAAPTLSLSYIGQQIVPSGTQYQGTTVGGLSGIDRDAASGHYVAISDDRSSLGPARMYELSLDLSAFTRSATAGQAGVDFVGVKTLLKTDGQPYAANTLDPESLRINPNNGNLVWSNEGQRGGAGVPALQAPTITEMARDGTALREFAVPGRYQPAGTLAGTASGDQGIRNNLAFESLSFSTDGRTLYTATENALVQDGSAATLTSGSPSRILSFNALTGAAGAEYAYEVAPVVLAPLVAGAFITNGLVELLALGDGEFIAVERSFSVGAATPGVGPSGQSTGNSIRLFHVDTRQATDVSGFDLSSGQPYTAVAKTLLLDLSDLLNDDGSTLALDNIEGIAWGPSFNGKPTLLLVSDNNFAANQFTQFLALSVDTAASVPEPATTTLCLVAGALAWRMRRRAD